MPELPEVETVARDLHAALSGWQVVGVDVRQPAVIAAPDGGSLRDGSDRADDSRRAAGGPSTS